MYKESPGKEATSTRRAQGRRLQVQGEPREGGYMYKESPGKEATCTRRAQGKRLHVQGEPREGGYKYKESPGKEATCTWPCFQFVSKHKLALNFV